MSYEQFQDRVNAVSRARAIFNNLTDSNISKSFEAYQQILADQDRESIVLSLSTNRPLTPLDRYDRPKCPDCNSDLMFQPLNKNPEGYKTMFKCTNPNCKTVLYSEESIAEIAEQMRKDYEDGLKQTEKGK